MKIFKFICLSLTLFILCNCRGMLNHEPSSFDLRVIFQDASGKDLLKGIEYTKGDGIDSLRGPIVTDFFTFKYSDSRKKALLMTWELIYSEYDVPNYGCLCLPSNGGFNSTMECIYQLTCPYLFGDREMHEIVAYFKEKGHYYECTLLTFDGKEMPIGNNEYGRITGTVVLD